MNKELALGVMGVLRKLGWVGTTVPSKDEVRKILMKAGYFVYQSGRIVYSIENSRRPTVKEVQEAVRNWRIETDDIPKADREEIQKMLEEHFEKIIDNYRPCNQREKTNYEIEKEILSGRLVNRGNTVPNFFN